jgi:AhpD family alkylhydroperoxidase
MWPLPLSHLHPNVPCMTRNRISLSSSAPDIYRAIAALDHSVDFDPALRELVRLRASQLNGCSYCVDGHATDARAAGESERRIWCLSVWRKTPFFADRERAALALTEALTDLPSQGVPGDVYEEAARHFPPDELANLIGAVIAINAWNRVGVGFAMAPEAEQELTPSAGSPA